MVRKYSSNLGRNSRKSEIMNPDLCKSIFARHAVAMIMHDLIQVLSYRNHMHARAWLFEIKLKIKISLYF